MVYDEVKESGATEALEVEDKGSVDVVVAADVLCYLADLQPWLAAASRALQPTNGLLAFSSEALELHEGSGGGGGVLRDTGRCQLPLQRDLYLFLLSLLCLSPLLFACRVLEKRIYQ